MALRSLLLALTLGLGLATPATMAAWEPIPEELRVIEDCPTEPGCSALLLRNNVTWDNDYTNTRMWHHRVIKVFTQEGLDAASVKIPKLVGDREIRDIEGRTVRPDGTVVQLKPKSVIEETVQKGRGYRYKVLSFQMPGVELGSILEYRYKIVYTRHIGYYTWWVQDEFPSLRANMRIRSPNFAIRSIPVSLGGVSMKDVVEDKQWRVLTLRHVPSMKEEPFMPPVREARGRIVFRPATRSRSLRDMRAGFDEYLERYYKRSSKAKKLARQVLGEAVSEEDKLLRIYHYIQENFENTSFRQSSEGEVEEDRRLYLDDVVVAGQGSGWDLTRLFVFIAQRGGMQAEVALVATRDSVFFRPELRSSSDLQEELAAVFLDDEWKFYDPGTPYCPPGMVSWQKEGLAPNALLPMGRMSQVKPSRADDNLRKRITHIQLTGDGGMTASVELEYHGLSAVAARNSADHKTAEERHHSLEESLKELFPGAELEDLEYVNLKDWTEPLKIRYQVQAEEYSTQAGGRLFVPIMLYPEQNPFTAEDRRHPIYFHQSFRDIEETTLEVPAGYEIESLPHGRTVDFKALRYRMRIQSDEPGRIQTRRDLLVDTHLVEPANYSLVRELYEEAARVDSQQAVLRLEGDAGKEGTP